MDSDDLVIISNEFTPTIESCAPANLGLAKRDMHSDEESELDSHPIIHTNTMMRAGKYRYHNYLRDTNDNCSFCHDFLLQAYRERRFGSLPPPPPPMTAPASQTHAFIERLLTRIQPPPPPPPPPPPMPFGSFVSYPLVSSRRQR